MKKTSLAAVRWPGILLLTLFFSRCATTRRYEAVLESWVGKDASALTEKWGLPVRIQSLADDNKVYEYESREKTDGKRTPAAMPVACKTTFVVGPDGIIRGWARSGYDCRLK